MAVQQTQNPNDDSVVGDPNALPKQGEAGSDQQMFIENTDTMSPEYDAEGNEIGVSDASVPGTVSPLDVTGSQVVGNSGIDPTRLAGDLVGDPGQFMQGDMTTARKCHVRRRGRDVHEVSHLADRKPDRNSSVKGRASAHLDHLPTAGTART